MSGRAEADRRAVRATVRGSVQGVFFRETTLREARRLGVLGWVRNAGDGSVLVHAEGEAPAVGELLAFLEQGPRAARVTAVEVEPVEVEGHGQFAVRGVSAGAFAVREAASGRGFELQLEVGDALRAWAVPKEPSMDPAVKRFAIAIEKAGEGVVWDSGSYEQGGRVAWPEAIERGHAVFVLHGEKLRGGFALQRTRGGEKPQWLLIKRREG